VLVAEGVVKRYGAREVLRGVSLAVRPGEIFGFVGPNGAGKTTFLKCVAGVARADGGTIRVNGTDARRDGLAARRMIGYAPGDTAMYDGLSSGAMLRFLIGFHAESDRARGEQLLDALAVPARRVRALSHGMKRKVLLAAAIASGAPLLMLDEPMEGLDPEARRLVERLLREEAARGRTVFFSSHDLASVERVCDRVAFLRGGRLMECGPVAAMLERAGAVLWVRFRTPLSAAALPRGRGWSWEPAQRGDDEHCDRWRLTHDGELAPVLAALALLPVTGLRDASGGLEEVFAALYGPEEAPSA
jgi:ABC-2 type transport system ATP-binding protein